MISSQDYETLRKVLHEESGHALGDGKEYLIELRLDPVAESLGFGSISELINRVRLTRDSKLIKLISEAMTTNESLFFRDGKPFDTLRDRLIPEIVKAKASSRSMRIWSAGASTGQEAYSIAMVVAEHPALQGWRVEILGTDYAPSVVKRAQEGLYNHFEVQRGLPIQMLMKYFEQVDGGFRVKAPLRAAVRFQEANLTRPFGHLGTFDLIFCRNVLIYFDRDGKQDVLDRMARVLAPHGYLFLGSSESARGVTDALTHVPGSYNGLYQPNPEGAGGAGSRRSALRTPGLTTWQTPASAAVRPELR